MLDSLAGNNRIVIVGAGNLATCLGEALCRVGVVPMAVWSRSEASASQLATKLGCQHTTCIQALPDADIVITAVSDDALPMVARELAWRYSNALLVHTAGSVPMKIWADASANRYGVFYPMQTFSKGKSVDFSRLGIFLEACDEKELLQLETLARSLTTMVYRATSEQRAYLHIAAVFACNFTNAMYQMAAEVLEKEGLPFEVMLPLIDETAAKLHSLSPADAQTGPAARGDKEILARQSAMLGGVYRDVYDLVSKYISKKNRKRMINYDLKKIKALVFDVDGVLSKETIPMHPSGEPMRTVNIKDGYALQLAVKAGFRVAIITGARTEAIKIRYRGLGITDVYVGASVKKDIFEDFLYMYELSPEEVMYMGDDIPDYEVMQMCGLPCCPADAAIDIKNIAKYVSPVKGGEGCGREVIEQIMRAQDKWMDEANAFGW